MIKLAILIPVFNNLPFTKKCLQGLEKVIPRNESEKLKIDTIVIDDGSSDGTSEWIKRNYPNVVLLHGDGNLWWSGGINMGAKHAIETLESDYLLLWNNDIHIEKDYFINLISLLTGQKHEIIYGSKIYQSLNANTLWSFGGYFNPRNGKKYMLGLGKPDGPVFEKEYEVDWLTGMGTVIPAEVVNNIGYWDAKNFPQYHGDNDFTYRAKLAGYKLIATPKLKIWNDTSNTGLKHGGSFRQMIRTFTDIRSQQNFAKNMLFYKKYATSVFAYLPLFMSYGRTIAGFFKWKLLGLLNIRKPV